MNPKSCIEFVDEAVSTQDLVKARLHSGASGPIIIATANQTGGRGRLGRTWVGRPGESLAVSIVLPRWCRLRRPWLIGMSAAVACASAFDARVQWPNDVVIDGRKVAGVLVELVTDHLGTGCPVVGIGLNLGQTEFPAEIAHRATSLKLARGRSWTPEEALDQMLDRLLSLEHVETWEDLRDAWSVFDSTRGKRYRLTGGEEAEALGIGADGTLLCSVDGETRTVLAAE
ncbi:MAG: biotin--[acetyl-CoA-carboxylase] ligase, partial [Fimbriimonadaceae bacterium]|nr:biotin--[acetyl-CoA-carboxylase] ligase [Fimbriimonadaceae bacterium]